VIAMILGFVWGGWTTSSTANAATAKAIVSSQAGIFVAQFVNQPKHEAKLKEFGELSSWTRGEFVEKGGWDKMPGQEKADSDVARACAEGLALLVKKKVTLLS